MSGDLEAIVETGSAAAVELAASELLKNGPCRNCGAPATGIFCANCGQERDTHRRSVFRLLRDLVEDVASLDSRILRTALALLFEPGELPKAFREGRTHRYMPALRLYFFVSLIFFLILSTAGIAIIQLQVAAKPTPILRDAQGNYFTPNPAYDKSDKDTWMFPKVVSVSKEVATSSNGVWSFSTNTFFLAPIGSHPSHLTAAQKAQLVRDNGDGKGYVQYDVKTVNPKDAKRAAVIRQFVRKGIYGGISRLAEDPAALNGPMTTWIPRVLFLLLPLYAILLALFYWRQRKKFYFVDHLIFSLSIHTFLFVLLIIAVGLAQIISGGWVFLVTMTALGVYILVAMKRFYEQGWFWTTTKFITISFIYAVFFLFPAMLIVFTVSFLGGSS